MNEATHFLVLRVLDNEIHNRSAWAWVKEIHDSYNESNLIFKWLIQNRYTGSNFVAFVSERNFNTFEVCQTVLGEMHREKGRKILLHRDFKA